jgi:hypothetical protein
MKNNIQMGTEEISWKNQILLSILLSQLWMIHVFSLQSEKINHSHLQILDLKSVVWSRHKS